MYNIPEKNLDQWVADIRDFERLMLAELSARRHRFFKLERTIREIRRRRQLGLDIT